MYLNNFNLRILEGKELENGYVQLTHNTQYRIILGNGKSVRCDAYLEIDGKHIGTWRLSPHNSITVERPAHDDGRFTFYQIGTTEAYSAGLIEGDPKLGLVKAIFIPELIQKEPEWMLGESVELGVSNRRARAAKKSASRGYAPGGTGLSGKSNQQFITVGPMELDHSQRTEINLRLIAQKMSYQPRPLTPFSTPVPPPID